MLHPFRWLISCLCSITTLLASSSAFAGTQYNMPVGVTQISREIHNLHMTIFWICTVIGIAVFSVMFWALLRHRASLGHKAASFHESTTVEIIWTIVPFIILIAMAIPATRVLIEMEDTTQSDITIKITGWQWKWHYDYLEDELSFFSNLSTPIEQITNKAPKGEHYLLEVDNALVLPINKKIRFITTSNDVNHAWWVPDLGVKKDAIPGFANEMWTKIETPGTYRGQCAELCGVNHGYMPIVVIAKTEEDYAAWLAEKKAEQAALKEASSKVWTQDELMVQGEKIYNSACAACHQVNGQGIAGVFPAMKASPVALGDIKAHLKMVLDGKPGTAMQAFGPQLSDLDIAAVVTYERNAWGNNTGDVVQPIDVKTARTAQE